MKIVLNARVDDAVSRLVTQGLGPRLRDAGVDVDVNRWDAYDQYDVAVFLGYDDDLAAARERNPQIRTILVDPKQSRPEWIRAAREADQLVVSSVEQRDVFLRLNRNILVWSMFPTMPPVEKTHVDKEPIVIGYHGNRVHLECMAGNVQLALEELGRRRPIEFWALYNYPALGKATRGMPSERLLRVRHIPWTDEFYEELANVDIGIVPTQLPIENKLRALEKIAYRDRRFVYEPFDHLIRLKASTNQGRLYPFARLGIPVVTDFAPSVGQFVRDGESGFVVSSPYGWLEALEALCESAELRNSMAAALRRRVDEEFGRQVAEFVAFCQAPLKPAPVEIDGWSTPEEELERLRHYPNAAGPAWRRAARSLRSAVKALVRA